MIERWRSFIFSVITIAIMTICTPTSAAAELIGFTGPMNFTGTGHGAGVSATLTSGSSSYTAGWAGELNWLWGADASPATIDAAPDGFAQTFYSYCVDIAQFLGDPQGIVVVASTGFYQDIQDPDIIEGGSKAAWLFNRYAGDIRNNLVADVNNRAAALQVAIWEAMYDHNANLSGGNFTLATGGNIAGYAGNYLTELYSDPAVWGSSTALILKTNTGQDQITNVPEPGTASLVMFGLFLVAGRVKRRP